MLESFLLNKSTGPDNIGNIVLKNCCKSLPKSLLLLYKTVMNKSVYPSYWKISQVSPVNKADVSCYRPISLLCCVSKVFEKNLFDQLYEHSRHKLHENQFDFRRQRSAVAQLLLFLDSVYKKFDDKNIKELAFIYLDFAIAFDKVAHHLLIDNLKIFGVGGKLLNIIISDLNKRKQFVKIENAPSNLTQVSSGVPQGSILCPLLFLIFINDLSSSSPHLESYGFADDFKLIALNEIDLRNGARGLENWCYEILMTTNTSKCKLLNLRGNLSAKLNDTELHPTNVQKDLGLLITPNLTWNENCEIRAQKATRAFFQLKRNIFATCSWVNKLHSYTGYIVPVITYCSQAWSPSRANLVNFERVQVMATKWILNCNLHYKGRLVKLKLLPLCLYGEMHDLLMYLSLGNSKYDISIAVESSKEEKTRQHSRGEHAVNKNRLNKSVENFFHRTKLLHNIVIEHYEEYGNQLDKKSISVTFAQLLQSDGA